MKKLFALLLCVVLVLSCIACAKDTTTSPSTQPSSSSVSKDTEPTNPTQNTDPKPEPITVTDPNNGTVLAVDLSSVGTIEKNAPPLKSTSFILEEMTLQLPFVPSELVPFGWNAPFGINDTQFVDPDATISLADFELCDEDFNAITLLTAYNDSDAEQSVLDCQITSFSMSQNGLTDIFDGFALPGGIGFNSTAANVIEVYGMPQENANFERVEVGEKYIRYIENTESGLCYTFTFDSTGLIQKITVSTDF